MTAIPDWNLVDPRNTDAELVSGSVAGDKAAFAQIYDRYADRLYDFCVGMLRDRDGAADCVQDTFCLAATRLVQLRDPDKLRPWLYSIARNEALRRLRQQRRETPTDELPDVQSEDAGPDTVAARTELAEMLAEAAGGLSDRDRAVFDLAYRHGLNGSDLADALGVTPATANTIVKRLRGTIERSLGALLVARRVRGRAGNCPELDQMLANWDGQFTVLMRKRISRHIESCPNCDDERRRLVSPAALLGAAPVFIPAPEWLRDKTLGDIQLVSHDSAMSGRTPHKRRWAVAVAVVLAVLGGSAALTLAWLNKDPVAIIPAEVSEPSPQPVVEKPAPPSPVPPPPVVQPPPPPPVVPNSPAPPSQSPTYEQPPAEAPAPTAVEPPDAAPPSQKPPMSFSPTVIAPRPGPPTPGGNDDGGGTRTGGSRVGGA
ncbi:sigma-70 family RNA polymerase sigma factor [Mycobacterium sp. 3519A]|uniref:sigma-70 family RNA polymerase sigma factor n=1 Tax=Mycobacterium sp. 3519A TaxID=2057184 RepID=UPI000C79AAEF|nr:sigma-70 family RNA polymerase sigma factor [Mycobacterium sp. 3519A]